ncbi:MAG: hypothetical protein LBB22_02605 [Treponema sp.]|jgi:hypothetical protein|nr:hypothetical protein [Treponema sp.]
MRKFIFLCLLCYVSSFLYSQNNVVGEPVSGSGGNIEKPFELPDWITSEGAVLSTGNRESRQYFELGLLNLALYDSGLISKFTGNSELTFNPLDWTEFSADLGLFLNPIYVKVQIQDIFVLDLFTGTDVNIKMNLPKKTIDTLKELSELADSESPPDDIEDFMGKLANIDSGLSASVGAFIEIGVGGSKTLLNDRLWVRAAPSLFFTLLYMNQGSITLSGWYSNTKFGLQGEGGMHLYSAWDLDSNSINPFSSPGIDLTLEALYALWPVLDTGVSISHIPLVPSTLNHRMSIDASGLTMAIDPLNNSGVEFEMPDFGDMITGSDNSSEMVLRPVRFDFYGLIKPFKNPILVIKPNIGFTLNTIFADAAFNWGLNVQFNAERIFSAFIGTGLTESVWANRIGIMLDFRAFEFDISGALAGTDFVKSWSGEGFLVSVGLKFGY